MTGDEMERAIEFLLRGQANHQVRLDELTNNLNHLTKQVAETIRVVQETNRAVQETNRAVQETSRIVQFNGETQSEFIRVVTRHIEAQGEINAALRAANARVDKRIDRLEAVVERHIVEGHGGA